MNDAAFPALGFNPARGNVQAVEDIAARFANARVLVNDAHTALKSITAKKDVWIGSAANAFASQLDDLPEYLEKGDRSLSQAARALAVWGDKLGQHQERACSLEQEAKAALAAATHADVITQQVKQTASIPIAYDPTNAASAAAAAQAVQRNTHNVERAAQAANTAWGMLEEIRRRARAVRDQWQDDADRCANELKEACDEAPSESFFQSFGNMFSDLGLWCKNRMDDLGDLAGAISSIASALAFIPLFTPFAAPIALATGIVALGAHGYDLVANDKWTDVNSLVSIVGDVAGVIPGVGALAKGFGNAVEASVKTGQVAANDMLAHVKLLPEYVSHAKSEFLKQMEEPSKAFGWFGKKLASDDGFHYDPQRALEFAKGFEVGANLSFQIAPTAALFDSGDASQDAKDAAGFGSALLAGITSK